ncbi:hypothetical protein GCM10012280_08880 [Wenjunlia tyrosinilytica]|uniref:Uncharacterized protein n=1 Tax=Wenjunlia tyrosinilytica TaxID=1544741 RepID=A0A918DT75_9ACTN|nr:hypothetical protein GCM10012280_08880 [Wenjunlia tyrosinilytica]
MMCSRSPFQRILEPVSERQGRSRSTRRTAAAPRSHQVPAAETVAVTATAQTAGKRATTPATTSGPTTKTASVSSPAIANSALRESSSGTTAMKTASETAAVGGVQAPARNAVAVSRGTQAWVAAASTHSPNATDCSDVAQARVVRGPCRSATRPHSGEVKASATAYAPATDPAPAYPPVASSATSRRDRLTMPARSRQRNAAAITRGTPGKARADR